LAQPISNTEPTTAPSSNATDRICLRRVGFPSSMLVLQSLFFGSRHGHGIATTIQRTSDELLLVDHGSLYPALQRLERAGLISSAWGISDNNRRARFYKLTRAGRQKLVAETGKWEQRVRAVKGVLQARPEGEQA
jgi:PadR family transcriptional regulator, regulatory protein PadR